MDEPIVKEVSKGGEVWMQLSVGRHSRGMVVWVKTIPTVEEFIAGLSIYQGKDEAIEIPPTAPAAQPPDFRRLTGRPATRAVAVPRQAFTFVDPTQPIATTPKEGEIQLDDLNETYGRLWFPFDAEEKIKVYKLNYELENQFYTLNRVGRPLNPSGEVNLSFLRFKGISGPHGVKFVVTGPIGRNDARNLSTKTLAYAKQFFTDYIAPFNINMRVSSTEI